MNQHEIDQATAVMAAVSTVIKEMVAPLAEENARLRESVQSLASELKELRTQVSEIPAPAQLPVIDLTGFVTHEDFEAAKTQSAAQLDQLRKALDEELSSVAQAANSDRKAVTEMVQDAVAAIPEAVNSTVAKAVAAIPAPVIPEIPEPVPGKPGRDAVEIDILPKIDPAKSYPRGSYARHAGGVWKAYRDTDGMHGWECVLRGIQALSVAMTDERTLVVTSQLSDGEPSAQTIAIPTVLDRGPYADGKAYEQGDAVTYGGSMWIAQKSAPSGRPGDEGSDGWRLAVRRGRDAARQPVKV